MGMERIPSENGMTALAGGGATGAPMLRTRALNRVTTVATAADSVMLPPATNGERLYGVNSGANSMNMFPSPAQTINALAADAALAIAAGKSFAAFCPIDGKWFVILSA